MESLTSKITSYFKKIFSGSSQEEEPKKEPKTKKSETKTMSSEQTQYLLAGKDAVLAGLGKAMSAYKVAALTRKKEDGRVLYDYITDTAEVLFDYFPTVLSPKKFFFPQEEALLDYTSDGEISQKITAEPTVLFGIRPCDLNGFKILEEAFAESNGDPNYLAKREQTVVVGMDCHKICDKDAFCYRVNANTATAGFDIMLHETGSDFVITTATPKGEEFCSKYFETRPGSASDLEKFASKKAEGFAGKKPFNDLDKLPEIFENNKEHPVWKKEADRCLSCGSCIMVCPTCYCFDVADEMALNLKEGQRLRRWDACMLSCFAEVASGENFREKAIDRLKHRIMRKYNYLMEKHGQAVCVGCGRCVRACLADISPKTIAEEITGDKE